MRGESAMGAALLAGVWAVYGIAKSLAFTPRRMLCTRTHRGAYRANRCALASTLKNACLTVFK